MPLEFRVMKAEEGLRVLAVYWCNQIGKKVVEGLCGRHKFEMFSTILKLSISVHTSSAVRLISNVGSSIADRSKLPNSFAPEAILSEKAS